MSNEANFATTNEAVLEFHVRDLEEAIAFYGSDIVDNIIEGIGRTAHLRLGDVNLILHETWSG